MSLKKVHKFALSMLFSFLFLISGLKVQANGGYSGGAYINANAGYSGEQQGMWGSGYYGGVQGCNQNWSQGSGAFDMSDEEKEERNNILQAKAGLEKAKLEKKRADAEIDFAKRKLERVFDSEILDFLVDVHMDLMNECSAYKDVTTPKTPNASTTSCTTVDANGNELVQSDNALCGGKTEIPEKLKGKWVLPNNQGYCTATSKAKAGDVSSKICTDTTLRPEDAPKYRSYSTTECGKALGDYKKNKIKSEKAQGAIEQMEDEIRERQYAISDAKERAKLEAKYRQQTTTETDCPECEASARGYTYSKPKRDWAAVLGQVGLGLGLGFLGKKYDDRNAEYSAQLGYPPQQGYPTAVSMGLPFILGGVYGAINGTSGRGGYGCASGVNGTGGVYGAGNGMNGPFGGAGGAYGPYANMGGGGAFGYPQGMYGTPWGGGMYNPGYGAGGSIAGPWGGYPGGIGNNGYAVNGMINGGSVIGGYQFAGGGALGGNQMISCFVPPCPGSGYAFNGGGAIGGGLAMNGGGGYQFGGFQAGGYQAGGFQAGGYQVGGYAFNGGAAIGGGGGYQLGGFQAGGYQLGGFQAGGYQAGGYAFNGGGAINGGVAINGGGGYQFGGYQAGGYQAGGYAFNGGGAINGGVAINGGGGYQFGGNQAGGYQAGGYMQTGAVTNGQYQLQLLQMQQQMQQQQMQQQMQYQQAQMQAQMQAYQRQAAVQQQAAQVQQEIASLQVRLQMLYSGAYTSNSTYNTGSIPYPSNGGPGGPGGPPLLYPQGNANPNQGSAIPGGAQVTVPTNGR